MSYRIDIMTLFPDGVSALLDRSITGRAAEKGLVELNYIQIREYTENKQMQVDDYPYGGGWGLVMNAQPLKACLDSILSSAQGKKTRVIYLSPQGAKFDQGHARRLCSTYDHLVLVCGHYEGIDERFIEKCVDEEISLGDFVMTGGEIAAMAVADSVLRLVPGVLADEECFQDESHWEGLLEFPQYTRPEVWEGLAAPEVLLGGNHEKIANWRRHEQFKRTKAKRPDMFEKFVPQSKSDRKIFSEMSEKNKEEPPVFSARRAEQADMDAILDMREKASEYLKAQGVDQWQGGEPSRSAFNKDIEKQSGWIFSEGENVAGYICINSEREKQYDSIDGAWLIEGKEYCAVHRIMVSPEYRGRRLSDEMLEFAEDLAKGIGKNSVRVDTHEKNVPMHKLLKRSGYNYCGAVEVSVPCGHDSKRAAYEKNLWS